MSSRPRLAELTRRGGEHLAGLTELGAPHGLTVRAIAALLPRRFDASRARDLDATLELRVRDPHGGEPSPLSLQITGGELSVTAGPSRGPQASAEIGAEDMIRLAAGSVGWPELLASGRMSFSGDPFLALRVPSMFRLSAGCASGQPVP